MKTKQFIKLLFIFVIFLNVTTVSAQLNRYLSKIDENSKKQIQDAFSDMMKNAKLVSSFSKGNCNAQELIDKVPDSEKIVNLYASINLSLVMITNDEIQNSFAEEFDKGNFNTLTDKALNAYSSTKNFNDFVYALTGKDIGDIKGEKSVLEYNANGNLEGKMRSDVEALRSLYENYELFFNQPKLNVGYNGPFTSDGCLLKMNSELKIIKFDYPNIVYSIKTIVTVDCECKFKGEERKLKKGLFEYEATVSGLFTSKKISFNQPVNPTATVKELECCPLKQEEEPISTEPQIAYIDDIMPDQYIGGGVGFGAARDFEEISYCAFAEYLLKISPGDENAWYAGLEGSYSNWSFNDASSNRFKIGPKIQYHTGITENNDTQFVAGLMGSYVTGNSDNGFSMDDLSGIRACIYGGINIRVCENWSLFGQFPILNYETITFKNDAGGEFKTDDTSLLLNKDNPLKLGIRFNF